MREVSNFQDCRNAVGFLREILNVYLSTQDIKEPVFYRVVKLAHRFTRAGMNGRKMKHHRRFMAEAKQLDQSFLAIWHTGAYNWYQTNLWEAGFELVYLMRTYLDHHPSYFVVDLYDLVPNALRIEAEWRYKDAVKRQHKNRKLRGAYIAAWMAGLPDLAAELISDVAAS